MPLCEPQPFSKARGEKGRRIKIKVNEMFEQIEFIGTHDIASISPLSKGWSKDKKFILEGSNGDRFLLRISDRALYDKKERQFKLLTKLEGMGVCCSRPIEFGIAGDGSVYTVLSYLDGTDGTEAVPAMSDGEAYRLGLEAGEVLHRLHGLIIPRQNVSWWESYRKKMPKKIDALLSCGYRLPIQDEIISYYEDNCFLMENRPLVFAHGDYHLGNMIVKDGRIGIIDFDKCGTADPYDDFKPFCWNVICSEYFETGLINGYFDNHVPDDFFRILKFYTAESLISHIPWAVTFGEEEIKTAQRIAEYQMLWYDGFSLEIPTWYKSGIDL